jgi:hypothetical protein
LVCACVHAWGHARAERQTFKDGHSILLGAVAYMYLRVRGGMMGSSKCRNVGESQSVLIVINPMISPRIRTYRIDAHALRGPRHPLAVTTTAAARPAGARPPGPQGDLVAVRPVQAVVRRDAGVAVDLRALASQD